MQQTIRCGASSPALPPFGPAHFHQQASSVLLPRWDAGVTFPSDAPSERKGQLPHSDDLRASFPICHRKWKERWRGWARSPLITFCPCPHPQGQLYCATVGKRLGQLSHLPQVASVGKQRAFFSTPHHHISHSHNTQDRLILPHTLHTPYTSRVSTTVLPRRVTGPFLPNSAASEKLDYLFCFDAPRTTRSKGEHVHLIFITTWQTCSVANSSTLTCLGHEPRHMLAESALLLYSSEVL